MPLSCVLLQEQTYPGALCSLHQQSPGEGREAGPAEQVMASALLLSQATPARMTCQTVARSSSYSELDNMNRQVEQPLAVPCCQGAAAGV